MFLAILGFLPPTSQALAQDRDAERIRVLEQQVAELAAQLEQLERTVLNEKLIARLDGVWHQRSHTRDGVLVKMSEKVIWQLKPTNSYQWILSPEPPMWTLGTMDLDATKDPAWITFRRELHGDGVRVIPGIIKFEGGHVHLALQVKAECSPRPDDEYPERPTSFISTKDNGVSLFDLERSTAK